MGKLYQSIARRVIFYATAGAMLIGSGCGMGEKIHDGFEAAAKLDPTFDEKTNGGFANKTFVKERDGLVERLKENDHDSRASWIERRSKKRDRILSGEEAAPSLGDLWPDWFSGDVWGEDGESQTFGEWLEGGLGGLFGGGSSGGGTSAPPATSEEIVVAVNTLYNTNKPYVDANPAITIDDNYIKSILAIESGRHIAAGKIDNIVSHTGAEGVGQFVAGNAAHKYDVCDKVTSNGGTYYCVNIDERNNVTKAIPASGHYLTDLYNLYDGHKERDRILFAVSSYNAGEGLIKELIRQTGKGTDATWEDAMDELSLWDVRKAYKAKGRWKWHHNCAAKVEEIKSHGLRFQSYSAAFGTDLSATPTVVTPDPTAAGPVE